MSEFGGKHNLGRTVHPEVYEMVKEFVENAVDGLGYVAPELRDNRIKYEMFRLCSLLHETVTTREDLGFKA